ncbi:MAG: TIGR03557 family F420-dependent LLM class oxidoreductase, partial [Acidimicrobiaceae bacterium]|nr:TIGR03557 family F420-dependent LLM class oxidoreductase [Acidimicrobiaceae bacterium]
LASEEHGPAGLVSQAREAERSGFRSVLISDHYHPWLDAQGESPFVWSVIGAIAASTDLRVTTGVTCPIMRIHPAVLAQAAATSAMLLEGRFVFGVGSGEALNEHILGDRWPPVSVRLEMLEEAVSVIRQLWDGRPVNHHGRYYTVENARLYSVPDQPPPITVSAFGPRALSVAARIGDGFITTQPDAAVVRRYRELGGRGPTVAAVKVCWDPDEAHARKLAHTLWATELLPGQVNQELVTPAHFAQVAKLVSEQEVSEVISCGPDPGRHAEAIGAYLEAGFDEVYVNQIGNDQTGFLRAFEREIRPRLRAA